MLHIFFGNWLYQSLNWQNDLAQTWSLLWRWQWWWRRCDGGDQSTWSYGDEYVRSTMPRPQMTKWHNLGSGAQSDLHNESSLTVERRNWTAIIQRFIGAVLGPHNEIVRMTMVVTFKSVLNGNCWSFENILMPVSSDSACQKNCVFSGTNSRRTSKAPSGLSEMTMTLLM